MTARLRYSFIPFLFDTQIEVDVADVTMHYQTATITQQTKLIQPPAITVDPPPFAFQADGVTDLSAIRGRLTIRGGDSPEVLGDRLIIHNETGSVPAIGSLQTFSQPRYTQIGEDANGQAIYGQDHDSSSGIALSTTSLELRGMGLGITNADHTALDGQTIFHGIEIQGIESIDIRMGDAADTFTVVDSR